MRRRLILLFVVGLMGAACSAQPSSTTTAAPPIADAPPTTTAAPAVTTTTLAPPTTTEAPQPTIPPEMVITATDYEFQGVPEIVPSGTKISLVNASTTEFHTAFIIRLPEGDERTREELTAISPQDLLPHFGPGRGVDQAIFHARPGESHYEIRLGGPMVRAPGRYVIMCFVPVGADPAEVEEQVRFGPPQQTDGVLRHDQVGQFAEFIVEG